MQVGQLFLADIGRDINPVIKVADYTEDELQNELEDYVVTDVIEKYLLDFLEHYTDTRQKQTDRVGVWISGYVGSGKSHFAKLLGLLTTNPQIAGHTAIDRFRPRLATCRQAREIERYLYEVATFLHTEVIGFQIDAVAIKGQHDDICNLLYRQFLAHRGLSTDLRIALLIEEPLIERGCLDVYRQAIQELTGKVWEDVRQRPMLYWDEIFDALARTLPERFKNAAAAQEAYDRTSVQPTFQQLAKDLTAYVARQQAQHRDREVRLLVTIDELGQFVADSGPRILDIQSFAEEIATHGKGKVWLVVTSHESMHDVVKNAREFRGDIKKLEGRFAKRFTLTTENIEQVEIGACGIRLVCLLLKLTGLDRFVGASYGTQHQVNRHVEEAIVAYSCEETPRLAQAMTPKEITVTQDETFTGGLCIVGMERVSNYILLEQAASARDHDTWKASMELALAGLNCKVIQSTSDEAPGLLAYVEHHLGAHHSPDLFHVQHELSKAISAPLAGKQRAAAQAVAQAAERLMRVHESRRATL